MLLLVSSLVLWLDGDIRAKLINEQKFALRFTPRIKNSVWSKHNRARALKND
jgi:hypothetical protein